MIASVRVDPIRAMRMDSRPTTGIVDFSTPKRVFLGCRVASSHVHDDVVQVLGPECRVYDADHSVRIFNETVPGTSVVTKHILLIC